MKTSSALIVAAILLSPLCALQVSATQTPTAQTPWPQFSAVEDLGIPLQTTQVITGTTTVENGVPVLAVTISGKPARFNVFDLENDRVIRSFDVAHGGTFWTHAADSKGDVFFAGYTGTTLYHYSVSSGELKEIGQLHGEGAACAIVFDEDDNVYIGTYPNAKIIKYERKSQKLIDLGTMLEGERYFKSLVYHDGYLYGGGMKPDPDFVRIRTDTLQVEKLPKANSDVTAYRYASKARNLLFMEATMGSGKSSLFVYDMAGGKWLDLEVKGFHGLVVSPEIDGKVYFPVSRGIWQFDLDSHAISQLSPTQGTVFRVGGNAVRLGKDQRFSQPSYVNLLYGGGIAIHNFQSGQSKRFSTSLHPTAGIITDVFADGDNILVGEFMGPRMLILDAKGQKAPQSIPLSQAESIKAHAGKLYFGVYPAASLDVFDPSMPVTRQQNPKRLFDLKKYGQSRPFGLTFSGSKAVVGMTADYGLTEGALAVYDLDTAQLQVFKNILPDQNYTSLTEKDGIVFGTTSVFGGLGVDPAASAGMIFSFDPQQGKIIHASVPQMPGIGHPIKGWGGIHIGPDGLLWAISYGLIAAFDPQTLQPIKQTEVMPTDWQKQKLSWSRYSLNVSSDGFLIANPGQTLIALNPADMQWQRILPETFDGKVIFSTLAANGDVYFVSSTDYSRLYRIARKSQP